MRGVENFFLDKGMGSQSVSCFGEDRVKFVG